MNFKEYEKMYKLEEGYWWFVARRNLIEYLIKELKLDSRISTILDIGCGTGLVIEMLNRQYQEVLGIDISEVALDFCRKRGITRVQKESADATGFEDNRFDVITALDVMEHIDNDLQAIKESYRIMKPSGKFIITVPAYGFLWSEHDEALHHRRRYTASELRNKLNICGFEIDRISYIVTFLFLPIFLLRFWQSIFKSSIEPKTALIELPAVVNFFLKKLMDIELFFLKYVNFPLGVSVFCIASKPTEN